jgi:hypothetical protein
MARSSSNATGISVTNSDSKYLDVFQCRFSGITLVLTQFEFEANYPSSQFAYHHGGRLAILPGPCHFLDMDKILTTSVFEQFNHDILKFGSDIVTNHWLKLYVLAEDRHLSTLYATKTEFKTAWVAGAHFFYKPEKTWVDTLQQRVR